MSRFFAACTGASLLLSGCALTGEMPISSAADGKPAEAKGTSTATTPAVPAIVTASLEPISVTPGASTGTFVGQKVEALRGDLARLQAGVKADAEQLQRLNNQSVQNARTYHNTVAAINAKLQVGTTRGNPILVQQWNEAQAQIEQLSRDLAEMNTLANNVAGSGAMASYLLESTRAAFGLSGAVDEDHRQLAVLEDEANHTIVAIDRLLNQLTQDVARQTSYLSTERSNLTTLALAISNGEIYGSSLATRTYAAPAVSPSAPPGAGLATGRPLVVIRFDSPNVQFEQPLFDAVSHALERRPTAAFDLVAVARNAGTPAEVALNTSTARRNADEVLRSLTKMGLPMDRVALSEITSPTAQSNEVHLYIR